MNAASDDASVAGGAPTKQLDLVVVTADGTDALWDFGPGVSARVEAPSEVFEQGLGGTPDVFVVDATRDSQLSLVALLARGGSQPVIVFGSLGDPDAMRYLDAGAADVVTARVPVAERSARVRAAARRSNAQRALSDEIHLGAVSISLSRHEVRRNGEQVSLSPHEFQLLAALLNAADTVVPHRKLAAEVWGSGSDASRNYLRIYIRQLRKKLERDPEAPTLIVTEWGRGYSLRTVPVAAISASA